LLAWLPADGVFLLCQDWLLACQNAAPILVRVVTKMPNLVPGALIRFLRFCFAVKIPDLVPRPCVYCLFLCAAMNVPNLVPGALVHLMVKCMRFGPCMTVGSRGHFGRQTHARSTEESAKNKNGTFEN
jgi:hypothetical protein